MLLIRHYKIIIIYLYFPLPMDWGYKLGLHNMIRFKIIGCINNVWSVYFLSPQKFIIFVMLNN